MMIGTVLELVLLDHYEGALQLLPIITINVAFICTVILFFYKKRIIFTIFKSSLVLLIGVGVYGTFLHLKENYQFEVEMKPTAKTFDLFLESLSGALPSLAPLSLLAMALIGYAYLKLTKQNL